MSGRLYQAMKDRTRLRHSGQTDGSIDLSEVGKRAATVINYRSASIAARSANKAMVTGYKAMRSISGFTELEERRRRKKRGRKLSRTEKTVMPNGVRDTGTLCR